MAVHAAAAVRGRYARQEMRRLELECLRNLHLVPDRAKPIRNFGRASRCAAVLTGVVG
jgi:hypothetical protein